MHTISFPVPDDVFERRLQANREEVAWSEVLRAAVEAELRRLEHRRALELRSGPEHTAGSAMDSIREDRDARR